MSYRIKGTLGRKSYLCQVTMTDFGVTCNWSDEGTNLKPLEFPDRKMAVAQARIWGPSWKSIVKVVKMRNAKAWPGEDHA